RCGRDTASAAFEFSVPRFEFYAPGFEFGASDCEFSPPGLESCGPELTGLKSCPPGSADGGQD
ncbi:MAG TPA: hypothetical protein VEH31_06655, partial [Streptosporangiaceae bacterium]|nr:hypothetical protein [Streptosporangiaceae bacterium]